MTDVSNTPKRLCSIESCENPAHARGWCTKHYQRWHKHGDPHVVLKNRPHVTAHGTYNEYQNYGCRCELCRAAMAEWNAEHLKVGKCLNCGDTIWTSNRAARGRCRPCSIEAQTIPLEERHGTEVGYGKGCRCRECRDAAAEAKRKRRRANPDLRERERLARRRRYWESRSPMQRATARVVGP